MVKYLSLEDSNLNKTCCDMLGEGFTRISLMDVYSELIYHIEDKQSLLEWFNKFDPEHNLRVYSYGIDFSGKFCQFNFVPLNKNIHIN